ncbi:Histone H4 [Armadillidium vulgare]|nr:Histone H4 [Armadillidium vulgare]
MKFYRTDTVILAFALQSVSISFTNFVNGKLISKRIRRGNINVYFYVKVEELIGRRDTRNILLGGVFIPDLCKGGKGLGKGSTKCHSKVLRDNIQGITKPAICSLASRGGVKRIPGSIYEETRGVFKIFLENVIRGAFTYTTRKEEDRIQFWMLCTHLNDKEEFYTDLEVNYFDKELHGSG